MQKRIDNFFKYTNEKQDEKKNPEKNDEKKNDMPKYFYLSFTNKFRPDFQAVWLNDRPIKINFMESMKDFYLCGYFPDYIDEKKFSLGKEAVYKNIPYLKSHLQKCIRKCDDNRAIQTARHLLKLDANELLRRLPIIMLEDVFLHESFTTILWFMIANKTSFKMQKYMYEWILGVIYVLCKISKKDEYIATSNNYSEREISKEELSILYSIEIRWKYGGTEDDILFLQKCKKIWEGRFLKKSVKANSMKIRPICVHMSDMDINDWDLSAIDYHCNNKFIELIAKKFDDINKEDLQKMIWLNSSGVNKRERKEIYMEESWNKIKSYVEKTQKYLLDSGY
jgi:hypothetical protein